MKNIFESEFNGFDDGESATKMYVFELENVDEFWELDKMDFKELCDFFGVQDTYNVAPGAKFYEYNFDVSRHHLIMYETVSLNV